MLLAQGLELSVIGPGLLGELGDGFEERKLRGAQRPRDGAGHLLGEAVRWPEGKRPPEVLARLRTWSIGRVRERTRASREWITARSA